MLNDPDEEMREHHTENIITQYAWASPGSSTPTTSAPTCSSATTTSNRRSSRSRRSGRIEYAWDEELDADRRLFEIILKIVALGTAAGRVLYNKYEGQVIGDFPIVDGRSSPASAARQVVAEAHANGSHARDETIREGQLALEPLSPFHMVVPPGIEEMRDFPWLIIDRPVPVDTVSAVFDVKVPEMDLAAVDQLGLREFDDRCVGVSAPARLKGHVLLSTGYEMPTKDYPTGRTVVWAGERGAARVRQAAVRGQRPPARRRRPFRYHKIPGRFWGLGVVEPLIGVQRQRNRARSQMIEAKDRMGLGRVFAWEDAITEINRPKGRIGEVITRAARLPDRPGDQGEPGHRRRRLARGRGRYARPRRRQGRRCRRRLARPERRQQRRLRDAGADERAGRQAARPGARRDSRAGPSASSSTSCSTTPAGIGARRSRS
jgi:hypothetical protein